MTMLWYRVMCVGCLLKNWQHQPWCKYNQTADAAVKRP